MTLKDANLQRELLEKGFVRMPLFNENELNEIRAFYREVETQHRIEPGRKFHTTLNTSNRELVHKVHDFLLPYFTEKLSSIVSGCNYTLAGFLVKDPGKGSVVTIHQDWNYVDESRHSSYSFWVSLENANVWNGCMQFIPGSHRFYPSLRISPDIPDYFDPYREKAADYLVDVPSRAGECVMFNQGIIHASRENRSSRQRAACILGGYPKNADLLHHFRPPANTLAEIEQYRISVKSMIGMKKDQRPPEAELLGLVSYEPPLIGCADFIGKCKGHVSMTERGKTAAINLLLGKNT